MLIPERLTSFSAYLDGEKKLSLSEVELPDIEPLTETIKGSGIGGEVETPTVGHFSAMTATLKFRTIAREIFELSMFDSKELVIRGSMQATDSARGTIKHEGLKVTMYIKSKTLGLGKLEPGAETDTSKEVSVTYIKIEVGNKVVMEIDQLNFICIINGVDYMEEIRKNLGM